MTKLRTIWILFISACLLMGGHLAIGQTSSNQRPGIDHETRHDFQVSQNSFDSGHAPCSTEKIFYRNGRITGKLIFWNNQPWERTLFEYLDELSLYSIQTLIYHGKKISIVRKDLFRSSIGNNKPDQKIETWYYNFDKDKVNALRQVDTYWPNTTLVKERQLFDEKGGIKAAALFEYDPGTDRHEPDENETIPTVTRMTLMNDEGEIVSDYHEIDDVDLKLLYRNLGFTEDEIARRARIAQDQNRTPIVVMDGGIDISHPELAYKLWKNPNETQNGKDDDGNGLADDIYGISDNPRLSQPIYDLRLPRFGLPAFSHGTLVASIATHGREDTAIMSVSEMTTVQSTELMPQIELLIQSHGIRYTNMSFIFDKQLLAYGPHSQRPLQIEELIENTPATLHIVAAGNGNPISGKGFNVDKYRLAGDLVPVMLPNDNILVVGALDTNQLDWKDYPTYKLAAFSNVGELSVDILAPGTRMCGAKIGGGTICEDGTSFAAPYVLNHGVLEITKANPDLNIYEIKEILLKSAYIPDLDHPFPVRSGGILHPERSVEVARWLVEHPDESVEAAVLAIRSAETRPIAGEDNSDEYLLSLQSFWIQRRMGDTPSWYALAEGKGGLSMDNHLSASR